MKTFSVLIGFFIFIFTDAFIMSQDYYRSNSIGMVFEKILPFRIDSFPWVIKLSKTGSHETRIIYFKGEEHKRLEYVFKNNELLVSEYILDELVKTEKHVDGLVVKEEYYEDGKAVSAFIYRWVDSQIEKTTFIENDIHIYDDSFVTDEIGNLKQIRRNSSLNGSSTAEFGYIDGLISTELYEMDDETSLYRHEDGKISRIDNWKDNELIRTKIFTYTDLDRTVIESDLLTGVVIKQLYNLDDKLVLSETRDGSNVVKNNYIYEEGFLVEKKVAAPGIRKKHLFYYDKNDSLELEKIYKDEVLIKAIFYSSGKKEIEKVYRDNSLVLIVYYKNDEKIREERIQ